MRRLLWIATGLVVKLGALLAAKAVLMLSVAAISLAVSMASFAIPALANAVWSATAFVWKTAVASPRETQRLRHEAQSLRQANQDLTRRTDTLTERNRDLQRENRRAAQAARVQKVDSQRLTADNRRLLGSNAGLRSQISDVRTAASQGARRIGQRAVQTTTRSVAAIPVESVPILGVSTILATTAWEIRDVCRTLDDMAEIQRALRPNDDGGAPETGFAERACDMAPLWRERGDHYGDMTISECREEAEGARDRIYNLARQARDEVPDLIDMTEEFDDEVTQAADAEYEAIIEICDCIVNLDCDPAEDVAH